LILITRLFAGVGGCFLSLPLDSGSLVAHPPV
jgi:hypothetical protein